MRRMQEKTRTSNQRQNEEKSRNQEINPFSLLYEKKHLWKKENPLAMRAPLGEFNNYE